MPQYRISNPARADIVDILRLSQTQFGDQARQRYQARPRSAASACRHALSHWQPTTAMSLHRAFAAITSSIHASRPKQTHGTVKNPRHIVFYRVANDDVIEVVRLLHDAMEVQLHLPNH